MVPMGKLIATCCAHIIWQHHVWLKVCSRFLIVSTFIVIFWNHRLLLYPRWLGSRLLLPLWFDLILQLSLRIIFFILWRISQYAWIFLYYLRVPRRRHWREIISAVLIACRCDIRFLQTLTSSRRLYINHFIFFLLCRVLIRSKFLNTAYLFD
jgi:hypothetical protein